MDNCKIEQCYLKLKKNENEVEASNSQLSQAPINATEDHGLGHYESSNGLEGLEILSKNCHTAELQCSMCNNFEECKVRSNQDNQNDLGK